MATVMTANPVMATTMAPTVATKPTATVTTTPASPVFLATGVPEDMWRLTASQAQARILAGELTVEDYALSLLQRINSRDAAVKAWAYLDPEQVLREARALDQVPPEKRGPLHGVPIAVKDVIYTKDMPTQHNSSIYKDDFPKLDAAPVRTLRHAGALIFGKTTTAEFGASSRGPGTSNPHDPERTPGGSSSGSGAAVGDLQVPVALGTQTGGSTIRPGSFNGIYALKPTYGAVCREGLKFYSINFDTLGLFSRGVDDLDLLAEVLALHDDEDSTFSGVRGARFAVCKTVVWPEAGPGTHAALSRAVALLRAHGAEVDEIELTSEFDRVPEWHQVVLHSDGRAAFLPDYRVARDQLDKFLGSHVENVDNYSRKQQLEALDGLAALRPRIDEIAGRYDALLTPSAPDEAPKGTEWTGNPAFCASWTALHTPVINLPGFQGVNGLPIGMSLVAPRYRDRHLLKVGKAVGEIFEAEGGWHRKN